MARIALDQLRHSYLDRPSQREDWALHEVDIEWRDAGAYALLGPSGCGKTTLLNLISGLLTPTEGRILFDGADVTGLPPDRRNIAQVFQFPVIYDTMTVAQNLAFPLRNRGFPEPEIQTRTAEIAEMLELEAMMQRRAANLTADQKQKISLGRGLVRPDVNVIMFDEPLTVIDPHLKWRLRSKLKELHHRVQTTMIYVTHDQTEALTFADQVVVMQEGVVVQIGTPVELFERPHHTFVGHFIGSPGMNLMPCARADGGVEVAGHRLPFAGNAHPPEGATLELGVRPEFVAFAETGLPVEVVKVADAGRYRVVETRAGETRINLLVGEDAEIPAERGWLAFDPAHTFLYADGWIVEEGAP